MTTSAEPVLRLSDVAVSYGGEPVVRGVTGALDAGASLALIGPNGAGKSTIIKAILGLVPVTAGEVVVLGTSSVRARGRVAYVPQAEVLDPTFPVDALQVVLMGTYRRVGWVRRPGRPERERARDALERVGLGDRARDRFGTLSGGQRQRVLLARAITQQARLLLLDEPFNGVDSASTDVVLDVLTEMRADGVAVVMATHDLSVAHLACGDACVLNRSQVAFGPIDQALTAATLKAAYGGTALVLAGGATIVTQG